MRLKMLLPAGAALAACQPSAQAPTNDATEADWKETEMEPMNDETIDIPADAMQNAIDAMENQADAVDDVAQPPDPDIVKPQRPNPPRP